MGEAYARGPRSIDDDPAKYRESGVAERRRER
jgi:hypothetical protein